jgi:hypothetical protein
LQVFSSLAWRSDGVVVASGGRRSSIEMTIVRELMGMLIAWGVIGVAIVVWFIVSASTW